MQIDPQLKDQIKSQRLRNLEVQYFELEMTKAAYEANGKTQLAADTQKTMDEVEVSYQTIKAL